MRTIKLSYAREINGIPKEKGEVVTVPDSFVGDVNDKPTKQKTTFTYKPTKEEQKKIDETRK